MKNKKLPNIVTMLILTTITLLFWIGFSVYRTLSKSPTAKVPEEVIKPLTPTLNTTILSELDAKLFFSQTDVGNIISPTIPDEIVEELVEQEITISEESTEESEIIVPEEDLETEGDSSTETQ